MKLRRRTALLIGLSGGILATAAVIGWRLQPVKNALAPDDPDTIATMFVDRRSKMGSDYLTGRVTVVEGWVVSQTEATR